MIGEGVTAISEAVSLQAKSYQPSVVGRMLEAQVRGPFTAMADDMILNGEESPEVESLTYESLLEMIDRFGLGRKPRNPYPPEHPLHAAWSFADSVESGDFAKLPWSYPYD